MKKNIIILGTTLTIISLLIFGFSNVNSKEINTSNSKMVNDLVLEDQNISGPINKAIPDLYYGVDTKFAAVKKSDIDKATNIYAFLNDWEKQQIVKVKSVDIIIIKDNQLSNIRAHGTSAQLTEAQIKLLESTDYFSGFTIRTEFVGKNMETGKIEDKFFGPHITVVPDRQAAYIDGKDALISYLKENSKAEMNIIKNDKLGAIKLSFTISKLGKVIKVKHDAMTSGYPSIDEKFIQLLKNIPGKWVPAENANGEKMEQELVFTFGPRDGC